ncbi:MAG: hypothetical protein HXX10_10915 [Rhodoplanes sp.]|uniref:hypothetical protein n=1 Tax=Rhodoplanes sp. TaxID=1968906 RepID=UPI00180B119A|nr:hypothetical protein [Rhodoplanes sp.]NVO14537.1 hypothetical protein [Rhodoplanes sp.]
MSEIRLSDVSARAASRSVRRGIAVVVAVSTVLIAATLALWAVWGPAVFYEVILAGIAACF